MNKNIIKRIPVPTGDILIIQGEFGKLECLSLGDYGKDVNLNQHKPVIHGPLLPLEEKWVITISQSYGCPIGCAFCDVPKVGPGRNATLGDMVAQIAAARSLHMDVKHSKRLNVHFARMGEPTFNLDVLKLAEILRDLEEFNVHPVVSTMMPNSHHDLPWFLKEWMRIKNEVYEGNAGLQLSINSTDEQERDFMFNHKTCSLDGIGFLMKRLSPVGRKITLNFAVAGYTVDPNVLLKHFSPDKYICKLTPMHKTNSAVSAGIKTEGDYTSPEPYLELEEKLQRAGYETLVFIASAEEDESRITCGNAILSQEHENK
jgi:23S rRNA (adenine2503-C2)-methyltransferase